MVEKGVMYQEAVKIPLMIKIPFIKTKPGIIENQVSQIDIIPTILDLMRSKKSSKFPGKSLLPLISGKKIPEDYIFIEWNTGQMNSRIVFRKYLFDPGEEVTTTDKGIIRTIIAPDGWKLCLSNYDHSQLFDLKNDPYETTNLFTDPKYRDKITSLANKNL